MRYGFAPIYWITIAGVPVVWIERSTGLTLPSGYTVEDGSLVIDDSAAVGVESINRDNGTAVSLALSLKLLDTATARDWLRRPSKSMSLTADLSATATAATVSDSAGWGNGDAAWLGMERITIGTVASSTSITGLTRATVGTLAYEHDTGTTSQIITDRPRYWRGRDVTLWATPADATGYPTGATLEADAVQVWRGRIDTGPRRERDGFAFQALSIDRDMDRELAAVVTGSVVDTSARVAVSTGYSINAQVRAENSTGGAVWQYGLTLQPFAADADGDLLTHAQIRDRVSSAWSSAVSDASAGGDIGSLTWHTIAGMYQARVGMAASGSIFGFLVLLIFDGDHVISTKFTAKPGAWAGGGSIELNWKTKGNPLAVGGAFSQPYEWMITAKIDGGAASSVTAPGKFRIAIDGGHRVISYQIANATNEQVYLGWLAPADGAKSLPTREQMTGADVEILASVSGSLPAMMLRTLMSSGSGQRSGTYDTLKRGQGYGLDESTIAVDTFTSASAPIGTLLGDVSTASNSFSSMFGGALGLFRKGVVARTTYDGLIKLHLVNSAPFGSDYTTTISDSDLLSDDADPIESVTKAPAPTTIAIVRPHGGGKDSFDRIVSHDNAQVDAVGSSEIEYSIPAVDRVSLWQAAEQATVSHLAADQTAQAVDVRVPPWIVAEPGDVVWIDSTHPSLYTWSTSPSAPGYVGAARVVGRRINLRAATVVLTLITDSAITVHALSPAALISAADSATAPTWIDIPIQYLPHMSDALTQAGSNIWLSHYQPGEVETATQLHEVSAAAESGGLCRLTIASTTGGHSIDLTKRSTLTLPTTNGGKLSAWQGQFAHVDDGTTWG
jgi:hypothetical protein